MKTMPVELAIEQRRLAALQRMCVLDTPPDATLDRIIALTAKLLHAPIVLISLIDANRQWFKARIGLDASETPRDQSFCSHAIKQLGVMVVSDATKDPRFQDNPLVLQAPHIRFYAGMPLQTQEGLNIGTLCVIDTKPREGLTKEELELLTDMAKIVMARLETLHSMGYIDHITKLPNYNRFLEDVEQLLVGHADGMAPASLAAIDIVSPHHYNEIVKAVGHRHAEQFIINAKDRLQAVLPLKTTVYHIGPARFAAIFGKVAMPISNGLLNEVAQTFRAPIDCGGIPVNTDISIGLIGVDAENDATHLLRALITTLDDVRERGVDWDFYNPSSDNAQKRTFSILTALYAALAVDDQLRLCYQPRVDLSSGRFVGVEALLRWTHPVLGPISPAEFIPLSEKTALIGSVTDWVIPHVLKQIASWRKNGHVFKVSINVSAYDIERGDFAAKISSYLHIYGVEPGAIELEFTENALVKNPGQVSEQLLKLRSLGIDVSIDDFGTGYCNISYLKTIPASVVKIDQSFIRKLSTNEKDRTIVLAMIELAHNLGHKVVAEGIETEDDYQLLQQWSCDEGQGYLMARPMEESALMQWIDARSACHIDARCTGESE